MSTGAADPAPIVAACDVLDLSGGRLWLDYAALGGELRPEQLTAWLSGGRDIDPVDFDRVVHAVNERFAAAGTSTVLPYADELA